MRPKGQSLGGRYRAQPVDPVTGRRLDIRAGSLSELESRMSRVSHVRDGLRYGDISPVMARGMLRPAVGTQLRVADLVARFVRGVPAPSVRSCNGAWRNLLAPWFGESVVWDLVPQKMRAWKTDLERARRPKGKRGYAPKYIRYAWDLLKGSVTLAVKDGLLTELPWGDFTVPNPKRPQKEREAMRDPGEFFRLLEAARALDEKKGMVPYRFAAIVFLTLTGLRQAEAAGLSWGDVDFDRNELTVRRQAVRGWPRLEGGSRPQAPPKGGKSRTQVMHSGVVAALRYQRSKLKAAGYFVPDGPVFPRPGKQAGVFRTAGRIMTPDAFRACVRAAGLPSVEDWTVHSTRHSCSRLELIGHGGDLKSVAERTGHVDLENLQGYLQKPARGAGGSKIPELPPSLGMGLLENSTDPLQLPEAPPKAPLLSPLEPDAPPGAEENWSELARLWAKEPGKRRPPSVSARAGAVYRRAYNQALRDFAGDKGEAKAAGLRARRGVLGAWAKCLAEAKK